MSEPVAEDLVAQVRDFLVPELDYQATLRMGEVALDLLDDLEDVLVRHGADVVLPAVLDATTRLLEMLPHTDDASGVFGDAAQRAVDLYARACRDGAPDVVALAQWLVRVRVASLGYPEVTLAAFAPALGRAGLAALSVEIDVLETDGEGGRAAERLRVAPELREELAEHGG